MKKVIAIALAIAGAFLIGRKIVTGKEDNSIVG